MRANYLQSMNEKIDIPVNEALRLDRQLCFALYSTSHALMHAYRPLLKPLGLTYPQYLVMLVLWEGDGISVGEICTRLMLDTGTLTPLLKRLEVAGHVTRRRSEKDERTVLISLTPEGRALKEQAGVVPVSIFESCNTSLGELARLKVELEQLRATLREKG